jgi:aspartyl-tRNA(Asn)/glutamyl-tRNA(Gln) amidotransferase subunit B
VGQPELRSPAEAAAYLRALRAIVRALEISDAAMETGSLRCDANVSLRRQGQPGRGARCEIKNLNSFKFLEHALAAEIQRQADLLDAGTPVSSVTLGYDPATDRVHVQRAKEDALDYRYLPEPDLPDLIIDPAWLAALALTLPELPRARDARYVSLGLAPPDAATITADPELSRYFDAALAAAPTHARELARWLLGDLLGRLHAESLSPKNSPVSPADLAAIVALADDRVTHTQARALLARCWTERRDPREIADELAAVDPDEITAAVAAVLADHPRQRASYLAGKTALRGFFVGQAMRALAGRADPQHVHAALDRLLGAG